jgi:hypothetical protein
MRVGVQAAKLVRRRNVPHGPPTVGHGSVDGKTMKRRAFRSTLFVLRIPRILLPPDEDTGTRRMMWFFPKCQEYRDFSDSALPIKYCVGNVSRWLLTNKRNKLADLARHGLVHPRAGKHVTRVSDRNRRQPHAKRSWDISDPRKTSNSVSRESIHSVCCRFRQQWPHLFADQWMDSVCRPTA